MKDENNHYDNTSTKLNLEIPQQDQEQGRDDGWSYPAND
tara:strand:- start:446 stop:562 length:117 start_codon:yes stop_codon:yes gene_type:complete